MNNIGKLQGAFNFDFHNEELYYEVFELTKDNNNNVERFRLSSDYKYCVGVCFFKNYDVENGQLLSYVALKQKGRYVLNKLPLHYINGFGLNFHKSLIEVDFLADDEYVDVEYSHLGEHEGTKVIFILSNKRNKINTSYDFFEFNLTLDTLHTLPLNFNSNVKEITGFSFNYSGKFSTMDTMTLKNRNTSFFDKMDFGFFENQDVSFHRRFFSVRIPTSELSLVVYPGVNSHGNVCLIYKYQDHTIQTSKGFKMRRTELMK